MRLHKTPPQQSRWQTPVERVLQFLSIILLSLSFCAVAGAATLTVDTLTDESDGNCTDGNCSLRDAIAVATAQV